MTTPIPIIESTPDGLAVSSETIAAGTDVQHKNVLGLIETHAESLAAFGEVAFETRPGYNNAPVRVALLNEQQATLVMTFMRNSERVVQFKVALVKAFFDMAQRLAKPAELSRSDLARMVIAAEEEKAALEAKVQEDAPKVEAYEVFLDDAADLAVRDAAQALSRQMGIEVGQNRLMDWLRANRWVDAKNQPYQTTIQRGLMQSKVSSFRYTDEDGNLHRARSTPRVTAKGLDRMRQMMLGPVQQLDVVQ